MKTSTILFGAIIAVVMIGACGAENPGQTATSSKALQTSEEIAALAFLKDHASATFDVLDVDCGLRSDAAASIVAHRNGPDGVPGTADDDPIDSLQELDSIYRVGETTIQQVITCADSFGYLPTDEEAALLNFLNDSPHTDLYRLDV